MCYHSNRGIAHCTSPPTCQVLLLEVPFILLIWKKKSILCLILLSPTPFPLLSCLPSHLTSSSVRGAIHTSYIQKKDILFLIPVPPTPSPLLSCLPSHLTSSSVRCAIHTSYMKRNSIVILFSSHPTPLSLSNHPPLVTTLWKENYKSAKCNIAFDRELKWLLALSPMI